MFQQKGRLNRGERYLLCFEQRIFTYENMQERVEFFKECINHNNLSESVIFIGEAVVVCGVDYNFQYNNASIQNPRKQKSLLAQEFKEFPLNPDNPIEDV